MDPAYEDDTHYVWSDMHNNFSVINILQGDDVADYSSMFFQSILIHERI